MQFSPRGGDNKAGCKKKVLVPMYQNIIAPQTLDQSEGSKVCGPDGNDKTNYGNRMHKLRLRSCREWWQHALKLTWMQEKKDSYTA